MSIKTYEMAARAGAFLAVVAMAGGAFASGNAGDFYHFNDTGAGTALNEASLSGLTGNGTVMGGSYSYGGAIGYPLPDANHPGNVLEIAGMVVYTNTAAANTDSSQVDFMFKVEPTDELDDPSGADVQIALAVGTNDVGGTVAPIKLWCKTASDGSADWVDLANVETGSWMRVTFVLDYGESKCSVSLDGNPVLNGSSKWFYFANTASQPYVKSITMVGSTQIDDFVVTNAALAAYVMPGGNATITPSGTSTAVTYEYMNKYGVTTNEVAQNATVGAGMTVADKFTAGLDPRSGTKFDMQTMNVSSTTSATVTFPGNRGAEAYEVEIKDGTGAAVGSSSISSNTEGEGSNTATLTLPENAELLYIKVKAKNR